MQSGIREGFFYRGLYFLLPANYQDTASFMAALHQAELPAAAMAVVLKEDSEVESTAYELGVCIAPYFISDYLGEAEPVVIEDADDVYPVQVELLTQQEYNDRLRALVTGYCPGCRGFGGLTKNDSSLSGHFDEISLDGFCPYRWETRIAPRSFSAELDSFIHFWKRYGYSAHSADDLLEDIKADLKLTYTSGAIMAGKGKRTLVLYSEKSTLIHTALTDVLAHYVTAFADENFAIRFNGRTEITAAAIEALLTPKKLSAARKELKKYGAALAVLEYRSDCAEKIAAFTAHLADAALSTVLLDEPGRCVLLLLNEGLALARIRYNAPMLESCGATVTVHDALKTARYGVSFGMKQTILEAAPAEAPKAKKITRKQLKAEEGRILKRDQVKSLLTYVDIRLTSEGCDHTLRFTDVWLRDNLSQEQIGPALEEIQEMGGYCDCEVLMNCYQDYDLED